MGLDFPLFFEIGDLLYGPLSEICYEFGGSDGGDYLGDIVGEGYIIGLGEWVGEVVDEECVECWGEAGTLGHPCVEVEVISYIGP